MKLVYLLLLLLLPTTLTAQIPTRLADTMSVNVIATDMVKEYTPPFQYSRWWKEIQKCVGLHVPQKILDSVKFVWVGGIQVFSVEGDYGYVGYAYAWDNQIFIQKDYILDEITVKHEMTHILQYHRATVLGHPSNLFSEKCKNKVGKNDEE